MNTPTEICEALDSYNHHALAGPRARRPDILYLGRRQHADLTAEAAAYGISFRAESTVTVRVRPKYYGMAVYEVDAESFVGFGCSLPSPCG